MSQVALDSRSSYHNSVQAGEILPDPLFTTLQSPLTMLPTSKGSGCSILPATKNFLVPFRTLVRAMLRRPGDQEPTGCLCIYALVCLFLSVFICVSVCACVSLTSCACLHVLLCMFICVCLCVFPCVCVSVCIIVGGIHVCVTVCLRMHLCVSAYVHVHQREHHLG